MSKKISTEDRELIAQIVNRAQEDYSDRFDTDYLTSALIAAHVAKPIRLDDLLNTCYTDFYTDVVAGAYRHYDPETDTIKDGWTAQHAEPRNDDNDFLSFLASVLGEEEDNDEYEDYHS